MFDELSANELEKVDGGCGWCYTGAALVIAGGALCGGPIGGIVAAVGVAGVLLV